MRMSNLPLHKQIDTNMRKYAFVYKMVLCGPTLVSAFLKSSLKISPYNILNAGAKITTGLYRTNGSSQSQHLGAMATSSKNWIFNHYLFPKSACDHNGKCMSEI